MDAIQEIQEIVDENKDQMPTGAVTAIMSKCQEAYKALPKLYNVKTVHIRLCGGELTHAEETLIFEAMQQRAVGTLDASRLHQLFPCARTSQNAGRGAEVAASVCEERVFRRQVPCQDRLCEYHTVRQAWSRGVRW